jgi:hypothetical protein
MPQHASAAQHDAARLCAAPGLAAKAAELDINNAAQIMIFFFIGISLAELNTRHFASGRRNVGPAVQARQECL